MSERADADERLPLQELVGTTLGEYRIDRILGHGSMGVVFEARHVKLGRRVALKALPPGLGAIEKAIQRFLREAQAVAQLSHDAIVPIYEISQTGAIHWYAMRFLEGDPVDRIVKRGPLDPRFAATLIQSAARAIHFAHQRGIIHRDLKPANMILDGDGRLVITDFGLARPEAGGGITDSGAMVGTPLYMSPEQIRARKGEIDRRTDIWSLGATLYEMVVGAPPFPGESTQEILQAILEVEPRAPRTFRPDLPADLEVVILKAMEKEPKRRYASALEMAQDLERFLEGEPIMARRTTIVARGWRRLKKHKTIVGLAAAIVVISLAMTWTMKRARDQQRARAYDNAIEMARNAFTEENNLGAAEKFEAALKERPDDAAARLGRARAYCFLGQEWEREIAKKGAAALSAMTERFTSVDRLYAAALDDVAAVLHQQPDQPLATFYRGFIGWRSRVKSERAAGFEDLFRAETLGNDDWETQLEFARFRLGVARDPKQLDASQKSEYLQVALGNATRAVQLLQERVAKAGTPMLQRWLSRTLALRGEIYLELYTSSGRVEIYLELARDDANTAMAIDPGARARTLETSVAVYEQQAKDDKATADALAAKSATEPSPAPTATLPDQPQPSRFARDFITLFGPSEKSDKAKMLVDLLSRGGEILNPLIAEVGDLGDGVMNRFINPYLQGAAVTDSARTTAETEADVARKLLQDAMRDGAPSREVREQARDHLRAAIAANPRNAQYHFELAAIEQSLNELEPARTHLASAVAIAPSNPIFRLQLALVCEQQEDLDQAAAHALAAAELAPGSVKLREIATRLRDEAAKKKAPPPGNGG
jgi:tetratricopeptide (TPR) repeat protein